jgi:hypothetical protein
VLNPPIVRDGVAYGLLLKFAASIESDPWPGREVVRGRILDSTMVAPGTYDIACDRGLVTSSRTRVLGVGNSFEEYWVSACGGNIAVPPEPLRIYGASSDLAYRGDMRDRRIEPGDTIQIGQQHCYVEQAVAFGWQPQMVDWRAGGSPRSIEWQVVGATRTTGDGEELGQWLEPPRLEERQTNPALEIDVAATTEAAGFFRGGGFFIEASGTLTRLTRRVYTRPSDGQPDDEWWPDGASLALGEYWLNGRSLEWRLASRNAEIGSRLFVVQWLRGWDRWVATLDPQVLEGAGTGEPDALAACEVPTSQDGQPGFLIFDDGAGDFGEGWIFWRFEVRGGSAAIAMKWSGGSIVALRYRAVGGSWTAVAISPTPLVPTDGVTGLNMQKTGQTIIAKITNGNNPMIVIGSANLGALVNQPIHNGYIGIAVAGGSRVCFSGMNGSLMQRVRGGTVWRQRIVEWPTLVYTAEIDTGLGVSPLTVAGPDGAPWFRAGSIDAARGKRRWYEPAPGVLRIYSENIPTALTATFPGSTPAGDPPGRAPRIGTDILNHATIADPESGISTTNVSQNRANWPDRLRIRVPDADNPPALAPGVEFIGRRGAVLNPTQPWSLQFSTRPADDDQNPNPTWQPVPSEAVFARPVEGVFLVSKDWLDSLSRPPCFRLAGTYIRHHANLDARTINELARAIEAVELLHFRAQLGSGEEVGLGGITIPGAFGLWPTGFRRESSGPPRAIHTGLAWGAQRDSWRADDWADVLDTGGLSVPIWTSSYFLGSLGGGYHTVAELQTPILTNPPTVLARAGELATDNIPAQLWPGMAIPGDPGLPALLGFGSIGATLGGSSLYAFFKLTGVPFQLPPQLRRCPPGTVVTSAFAEVRVANVESYEWEWTIEEGYFVEAGGTTYLSGVNTINGELYRQVVFSESEGTTIDYTRPDGFPPPRTSAPLSFDLVGRRRNTARVPKDYLNAAYLWSGGDPNDEAARLSYIGGSDFANVPADGWFHFAAAGQISTGGAAGNWRIVDLRGAMQAALDARVSLATDLYLVPRGIGLDLGAGIGEIAQFLRSCLPQTTIQIDKTGSGASEFWNVVRGLKGQCTTFDSFEMRNLMLSIQLPSGAQATYRLPLVRRAMGRPD